MLQLPELYNRHLSQQFNYPQYLILLILINLLQNLKTVRLEELARRFPCLIQLRSRVKKLQRFLVFEQFNIETLWFPILKSWLQEKWSLEKMVYLVIDRSQWREINLLMVSLIYNSQIALLSQRSEGCFSYPVFFLAFLSPLQRCDSTSTF